MMNKNILLKYGSDSYKKVEMLDEYYILEPRNVGYEVVRVENKGAPTEGSIMFGTKRNAVMAMVDLLTEPYYSEEGE